MRQRSIIVAKMVLAAVVFAGGAAHAAITGFGSLTDSPTDGISQIGDGLPVVGDFISLSVTIDSGSTALISARFAPNTYSPQTSLEVDFDVDKNPSTGAPGRDSLHNDSAIFGVDAQFNVYGSGFQSYAQVGFSGTTYPVTYLANGFDVSVPLTALNSTDGLMNFAAVDERQLTANTFNGINDYISDVGQPVGSINAVPEPGCVAVVTASLLAFCSRRVRRASSF